MKTSPVQESHPFVSRAELLVTFDGDADFVREIVATFLMTCPETLRELRVAFDAGDAGAVSRAAHSLKGSMSYFEQGQAYAAAQQIENVKATDLRGISPLVASFELRMNELTRYLSAEFPA